jgi:transcriptional regulator with XRE-family HTH domain
MMGNRLSNREFIKHLKIDPEFKAEYDVLAPEFELLDKMLSARTTAGLSQAQVAKKMHTTTSAVGRLETAGGRKHHSPSLRTLERYAKALGYTLRIDFVPTDSTSHFNS